jgi:hypothetical protein
MAVFVTALPHTAAGQLAPTGGHYGGRSSDTGFTGPINPTGGFSASVPILAEPAHAFTRAWIACQARSVSATLHAWATQPSGRNGASPSKISAIEPTQPSSR